MSAGMYVFGMLFHLLFSAYKDKSIAAALSLIFIFA